MKNNKAQACDVTGFVPVHATACEGVAKQMDCIILFREPGTMARGLIEDHYCMKGFRIDTKSCTWGPMSGFVCVDPRLTKDPSYHERNAKWTAEAVSGHIVEKFFGEVTDAAWVADVMPIAISQKRIDELQKKGVITPRAEGKELVGESKATNGSVVLNWRLVPVGNASNPWLKVADTNASEYFVLCVNTRGAQAFKQQYPGGVKPIPFRGHETILGLTNPGTKDRGFKACVTADYDLFAIWPKAGAGDGMAGRHALNAAVLAKFPTPTASTRLANGAASSARTLPAGVARMPGIDDRLQSAGYREHHRFGDVSGRVMLIKTMLNTALIGAAGYKGGNAIHHNDEAGNFALAKGTLSACLPLIGFTPVHGTVLIENLSDFKELVLNSRQNGFQERAKPEWLREAGIVG